MAGDMNLWPWGQSVPVRIVHARWGAGAAEGMYHVYVCGEGLRGAAHSIYDATPFDRSYQCVVDDFGTLRRVQ